jgi:glyoxylase-like metal-dependent hydrolase (beta-lactamase superfamily II)
MHRDDAPYHLIDLHHMGHAASVAACLIESEAGPVLVDPGPAAALPALREALAAHGHAIGDLAALLLTHIHLDHAGASGTIARENSRLAVYVHEAGAPHVADPSKLVASATRLYGDRMEQLWGEVAAVPAARIEVLRGGEKLRFGRTELRVAYTPGHAWHHVSYLEPRSGTAFVGDVAGLRTPRLPQVVPPTPPPDFDLEAWLTSIDRIMEWRPAEIVLTHFGPFRDTAAHFEALREGLVAWTGFARAALAAGGTEAAQEAAFLASLEGWARGNVPDAEARAFLDGAKPEGYWRGLARYWTKRGA